MLNSLKPDDGAPNVFELFAKEAKASNDNSSHFEQWEIPDTKIADDKPVNYSLPSLHPALARLKAMPHWVVWRWVKNDKGWTKPPFVATSPNKFARNNDPRTWRTYDQAVSAVKNGKADGVGFCLLGTNISAFDVDDCRNPETMEIDPWAMKLVKQAASYFEITPSGTGLRIIGLGSDRELHAKIKVPNSKVSVETYRNCARYITISNCTLPGATFAELADIDKLLDEVVERLRPTPPQEQKKETAGVSGNLPDQLLNLIRNGAPDGERSDQFFHAVKRLKEIGYSLEEVIALFARYPKGIRAKYKSRWENEVRRSYGKPDKAVDADKLILDPANPIHSARELLAAKFTLLDGLRTLHRHRGAFWDWIGSHYRQADDETVQSVLWNFLDTALRREKKDQAWDLVPFKPNRARVGDAIAALNAVTQLDKYIEPPSWLTTSSDLPPPDEFLACANGLLHLPSGEMYPTTPDYFNLNASEVMFDPEAPPPVQWQAFLDQIFDDDIEAKNLLQEWFGYVLAPDTSQQKILLMVGPKRSGKGTIGRVKTAVLGRDSVAGPTMSSLADPFGLEPLITKPLAIISDARIGRRTDKSAIVERLLSISGEDTMTVPRKYLSAWTGKLPTRFEILTNELPSLNDGSGALAGRFVILIMTKSFFGREDPTLTSKLLAELPGILNWSIEGYRRLRHRGYFIQPQSSCEAADDIEMLAAPVRAFVRDCCNVGPGLRVPTNDLYLEWKAWSEDQGLPDAGSKIWFGRNLRSAVPGVKLSKSSIDDDREQIYRGIALNPHRATTTRGDKF